MPRTPELDGASQPVAPAYVFGRSAKLGTYSLIINPARSFAFKISICARKDEDKDLAR